MQRLFAIISLGLVLVLIAAVVAVLSVGEQNTLIVENHTGQAVIDGLVVVSGNALPLGTILTGETVVAAIEIDEADAFLLDAALEDGTRLGGEFGSVRPGMRGVRAVFKLLPEGEIRFEQ